MVTVTVVHHGRPSAAAMVGDKVIDREEFVISADNQGITDMIALTYKIPGQQSVSPYQRLWRPDK